MLKGALVMARLALAEVLHKKVILAAAVLTLAYLTLYGLGLHYTPGANPAVKRMIAFQFLTMALYLGSLLTAALAALTGAGAISGEVESGTAYALLARPVSRPAVLLGKYLGCAAFMAAYAAALFAGLWLVTGWQAGACPAGMGQALPLFVLQPLVVLALTFLLSASLTTMGAGVVAFILFAVSLVGGMVEQIGAMMQQFGVAAAPAMLQIGVVASLILPADALYRRAVYTIGSGWSGFMNTGPFGAESVPSAWMVLYAVFYLLFCLGMAVRVFGKRDV